MSAEDLLDDIGQGLQVMADMLYMEYMLTGNMDNLDYAVDFCKECIERTPEKHERAILQGKLVGNLTERYVALGSKEDLNNGIVLAEQLYKATASGTTKLAIRANNYAILLKHRFHREGNPDDLNEAVRLSEEAVSATPQAVSILRNPKGTILQDPEIEIDTLNSLAATLQERNQLTGSLDDLNRSIEIMERLLVAVLEEDSQESRHIWLSNLSSYIHRRYEQSEGDSLDDLNRSIDLSREALEKTRERDPSKPSILCGLAHPLGQRAEETKKIDDLDMAVAILREAREITPKGHPLHIEIGVNLAMRIFQRSEMADSTDNLNEAIKIATATLSIIPPKHPSLIHLKNFLGLFHYARFRKFQLESDAQKAVDNFQVALESHNYTPVYRRVQAGRLIVRLCCTMSRWHTAYEASIAAIGLIPKLMLRSLRNSDKQKLLSGDDVVGFSSDAVAATLNSGMDGCAALGLLEMGRGSLAASVTEMRADISTLQRKNRDLAEKFDSLRDELQINGPRQYEASREFDVLLDNIRREPGFKGFLKPPSNEDIREAARDGPIAVLSASEYRGVDAILVERDRVRILYLKEVKIEDLEEQSGDLASHAFLKWLWDHIAKPILDALGFTGPPPDKIFPRIWWIPTGILSRFPFHAAGHHYVGSTDTVIDRVMSSYSLSIKALLDGRRRAHSPPRPQESKALLIAMKTTPKYMPLGYASQEIQMVEGLLASKDFDRVSLKSDSQKKDVLQHLEACQIFHFAGHGKENATDPSHSTLLLHDWETDPMTVGSILDVYLSQSNPFLAYLSACETGQVTKAKFRDESIHLIAAYQLAGFRHVIGTLWSVEDFACVEMATEAYQRMLNENMTDESVCRGLHIAARKLRDETRNKNIWRATDGGDGADKAGARKIGLADCGEDKDRENRPISSEIESRDSDRDGKDWIPYVHFGV